MAKKAAAKPESKAKAATAGKIQVAVETQVKSVTVKKNGDVIVFKNMTLRADEVRRLSIWAKEAEHLRLQIDGDIVTPAILKNCVIGTKDDLPKFIDMRLTPEAVAELDRIIKDEAKVTLTLEPDTEGLFDQQIAEEEAEAEEELDIEDE